MGDGVLAYFGYPRAHGDDAERAIRAGLGVIDVVGHLDVKSVKLQARVGIATGLVAVDDLTGEGSAQEQSVVGETPNLAARLQALAEPKSCSIALPPIRDRPRPTCDRAGFVVRGAPYPNWRPNVWPILTRGLQRCQIEKVSLSAA
jgi:Adenylate and Guanylate cyclase catalytic domain